MAAVRSIQPPSPDEVAAYAASIGFTLDGGYFVDYWETRGWMVRPGIPMRSWQAAVRNWKRMDDARNGGSTMRLSPAEEKKREANARRLRVIEEAAGRIIALRSWLEDGDTCPYSKTPKEDIEREKDKIRDHFGPQGIEDLRKAVVELKRKGGRP